MSPKAYRLAAAVFALLLIAAGFIAERLTSDKSSSDAVTFRTFSMDTSCTVVISGSKDMQRSLKDCISQLDAKLSAYSEGSPVAKLNSGSEICDDVVFDITKKAVAMSEKYPQIDCTSGRLIELWDISGENPHVPSDSEISKALSTVSRDNIVFGENGALSLKNGAKLNFGSCAKGYALDRLYDILKDGNAKYAQISFESSILLYGKKENGEDFVTALRDPDDRNGTVLTISTGECFISTSGGYERFFEKDGKSYTHIFDLTTGMPADSDLASVTVISKDGGMLTDFLSTAIFIGGTEHINEYLSAENYSVIALDKSKSIYCSESIKDNIDITDPEYHFSES